jgi:hypothetical protein
MANRKRIFGWIAYCGEGVFHLAAPNRKDGAEFRFGTLWFGGPVTVFKSKRAAKRAIRRTRRYRDKIHPGWWPWIDKAFVHSVGRMP